MVRCLKSLRSWTIVCFLSLRSFVWCRTEKVLVLNARTSIVAITVCLFHCSPQIYSFIIILICDLQSILILSSSIDGAFERFWACAVDKQLVSLHGRPVLGPSNQSKYISYSIHHWHSFHCFLVFIPGACGTSWRFDFCLVYLSPVFSLVPQPGVGSRSGPACLWYALAPSSIRRCETKSEAN